MIHTQRHTDTLTHPPTQEEEEEEEYKVATT